MKSVVNLSALRAIRGKLSLSRLPRRKVSSPGNPPGGHQYSLVPSGKVPLSSFTPGTLVLTIAFIYGWAMFCETAGKVYHHFYPRPPYVDPYEDDDDYDDGGYHPTHDQEIP